MISNAVAWAEVEREHPVLAAHVSERMSAIAYLATTRKDGSPRVHPVGVNFVDGRLLVPMTPTSPKAGDLRRDGRFACHCTVEDTNRGGGEVLLSGVAAEVEAPPDYVARGWIGFELRVSEILAVTTTESGIDVQRWRPKGSN